MVQGTSLSAGDPAEELTDRAGLRHLETSPLVRTTIIDIKNCPDKNIIYRFMFSSPLQVPTPSGPTSRLFQ